LKRISSLIHPRKRFELLRRIRKAGYGVRMHAYEYYIWKRGFVSVIFLQPYLGKAYIYNIRSNREESEKAAREIFHILRAIDKHLQIEIIQH